jgi:hypothetical protein
MVDEEPRRRPPSGASPSSRALKISLCLFLGVAACNTPLQHDLFSVLGAPKAYTIVLSAGAGGKVSATTTKENCSESSVLTIKAGKEETIGITAKSDAGYSFSAWAIQEGTASVVDYACSSTSLTTQASSAKVTASFIPDHYLIS